MYCLLTFVEYIYIIIHATNALNIIQYKIIYYAYHIWVGLLFSNFIHDKLIITNVAVFYIIFCTDINNDISKSK